MVHKVEDARRGEGRPSRRFVLKTVTMVVKAGLRMRKEDIGVKRTETTMTILGEKREKEKVAKENYCRIGSSYGSFSRSGQKKEKKVSIK